MSAARDRTSNPKSPVKRFRCWCGSNAEEVEPRLKTLYADAWYVSVADYEALEAENKRLRELLQWTAEQADGIRQRYYQTAEGRREEDQIDFASGKPGYEERSKQRGLR